MVWMDALRPYMPAHYLPLLTYKCCYAHDHGLSFLHCNFTKLELLGEPLEVNHHIYDGKQITRILWI